MGVLFYALYHKLDSKEDEMNLLDAKARIWRIRGLWKAWSYLVWDQGMIMELRSLQHDGSVQ